MTGIDSVREALQRHRKPDDEAPPVATGLIDPNDPEDYLDEKGPE